MAARRAPGRLGEQGLARGRGAFGGVARDDGQRADADADLRGRLRRCGGKRRLRLARGAQGGAGRHRAQLFGPGGRGLRSRLRRGLGGLGRGGAGRGAGCRLRRGRLRGRFPRQDLGRGPGRCGRARCAQLQPFGRRGQALGVGGQARRFRRGRGGGLRLLRPWRGEVAKALQDHPRGDGGRRVAGPGRRRWGRLGPLGLGRRGLGLGCGLARSRARGRLGPGGGQGRPCRCRGPLRRGLPVGRRRCCCCLVLRRPGPRRGGLGLRCRPGLGRRGRRRARRRGGRCRGQGRGLFGCGDSRGLGRRLRSGCGAQPGLGIARTGEGTDQRCQPGRAHHGSSASVRAARMRRR
ncbi:hypothetical protein SAMN04244548_00974 [Paracoccus pantotrophus]|nr:hypothetical protein SAMN04244548_00974 [Paracoccus pantotrophus]